MPRNLTIKALFIAGVSLLALLLLVPTLTEKLPHWWPRIFPKEKIRLGLDLQGGMHLVLEVEVAKAVSSAVERTSQEMRLRMRRQKIRFADLSASPAGEIRLTLLSQKDRNKFEELQKRSYPEFTLTAAKAGEGGQSTLTLQLDPKRAEQIRQQAASQALETIRNRVDQFGVSEPEIVPQSAGRILVQLPGIKDPGRAKRLIGKTAQLEFKLVDESARGASKPSEVPAGSELRQMDRRDRQSGRVVSEPIVLKKRTLMTGETITDARMRRDSQMGEPIVLVKFDGRGTRQFGDITRANVGKRLAILLDGRVRSAPVIKEAITGGEAVIEGDFTMEEARDLAVVLRAGALPAPVKIAKERTVGPSLGQDSINAGIISMIVGFCLVVLFILIYYKLAGLAANLALILNVILISAVLAAFQAVLTLPGIAGIILTIGMAVDANVLIFERVREEQRLGKTPSAAVDAGFGKALITILDANITTFAVGLVLFQFGTGPIKGFAVTLMIGIATSLFTALIFTRLLFDMTLARFRPERLSI